jgi:hypothetical protein
MAKNDLVYLVLIVSIFAVFVYLLDANKVKADVLYSKVSFEDLKDSWEVAEVTDLETGKEMPGPALTKSYQFLSSGGFVEYNEKRICRTGNWHVINNRIHIQYDSTHDTIATYQGELVGPAELLLLQGNQQLRLVRRHL